MSPQSRLWVIDAMIPAQGVSHFNASIDIQMLNFGGIERTESQWRFLLENAGLRIAEIIETGDIARTAIIEAVLRTGADQGVD